MLLTLLDSGSHFIPFPFIEERFADQASQATLSWVVSAFFIVMVSILLVAGRLADRFGRRRVFLTRRAFALGVWGTIGVTAAIVGDRTGAAFADVFVWVWMFGAAVYLIGGLAAWFWYPSGRHDTEPSVPVTA